MSENENDDYQNGESSHMELASGTIDDPDDHALALAEKAMMGYFLEDNKAPTKSGVKRHLQGPSNSISPGTAATPRKIRVRGSTENRIITRSATKANKPPPIRRSRSAQSSRHTDRSSSIDSITIRSESIDQSISETGSMVGDEGDDTLTGDTVDILDDTDTWLGKVYNPKEFYSIPIALVMYLNGKSTTRPVGTDDIFRIWRLDVWEHLRNPPKGATNSMYMACLNWDLPNSEVARLMEVAEQNLQMAMMRGDALRIPHQLYSRFTIPPHYVGPGVIDYGKNPIDIALVKGLNELGRVTQELGNTIRVLQSDLDLKTSSHQTTLTDVFKSLDAKMGGRLNEIQNVTGIRTGSDTPIRQMSYGTSTMAPPLTTRSTSAGTGSIAISLQGLKLKKGVKPNEKTN